MPWVTINGSHILIGEPGMEGTHEEQIKAALAKRSQRKEGLKAKTGEAVAQAKGRAVAEKMKGAKDKPKPIRGEMKDAQRVGTGKDAKIIMADGSPAPDHIKAGMIPPAWTNVRVSVDPNAELLVTGKDAKGRPKQVLTKGYETRAAVVKFKRTEDMMSEHERITKQIHDSARNPHSREEAHCAWLMQVQATRPGSDRDTKASVKAYGATTLEARHVVQSSEGVRLKFIGKEGIAHDHLVRDPELAKMLLSRKNAATSDTDRLFKTTDAKVRDFTASLDGGKFTPKDFRTSAATRLAKETVDADSRPSKSMTEHKKRIKEVAVKVSNLLGNRPSQALESYIHPAVFAKWSPA